MEDLKEKAESLVGHVGDYVETLVELNKVNASAKVSNVTSHGLVSLLKGVLILFVVLFLSIAMGLWIGKLLQSNITGFLIIAGIYLVLLVVVLSFDKKLLPPIRNAIVRKIYE